MNKNNPYGYKVGYRENGNRLFIRHFTAYTYKQARFFLRLYHKYPQYNHETNKLIIDPFWQIKPITKKEYLAGIWDEIPFKRKTPLTSATFILIHGLLSIVTILRIAFFLPLNATLLLQFLHP